MKIRTLTLSIAVLLSVGATADARGQGGAVNPSISVSASSLVFSTPVVVTQVASSPQVLVVSNTGSSAVPITVAVSGDFTVQSGCPQTLTAGGTCVVQVGFAPSQPDERDGILSIGTGTGYSATAVSLTGTGLGLLPDNTGTLGLWETLLGEPVVTWYKVQQPVASLTATSSSNLFGVAFVAETGSGHGQLPAESFTQTATANCNNCWLGIQFYAQTAGTVNATLALASNAGGSVYSVGLTGTALPTVGLMLSPVLQDFGAVTVNSSSAGITFSLTNMLADAGAVTVGSVSVSGDFAVLANTTGGAACSGDLAATATCFVVVGFAPTATGERDGTLTIVTSGGTVTASLTGTGAVEPGVGINPVALTFANVPGVSATQQTVTLVNTGSASVEVGAVTSSDPSFSVSTACGALAGGASCGVTVVFTPQSHIVAASLAIPVTAMANGQAATTVYSAALTGGYTTQSAGLELVAGDANFAAAATGALGATRQFTLNNLTAETLDVSLTMPRQFVLASPAACATLAAGGSCTFSVSFLPVTGGPLTGSVMALGVPEDGSGSGSGSTQALAYMLGYGAASGSLGISGNLIPNTPLNFGQVNSGQSVQQVLTLTNNGSGPLTIHRVTIAPPFFSASTCGVVLAANGSCQVTVTYAPIDEMYDSDGAGPRMDAGGLVIESDAASSPDEVEVSGTVFPVSSSAPNIAAVLNALGVSEGSLTFANTQVGDVSEAQTVVLTNTGTTTLQIASVGVATDFTASSSCTTLLPGATCSVQVQFAPTTASSASVRSGTLSIASDAGTSLEFVSLLGTSVAAPLTLSPTALDFGTVNVGASDALSVNVTNVDVEPVMFLGLAASGDYSVAGGTCPAVGSTLAAGASCTLTVTFTPTVTGTRTGVLSLSTDATQTALTVSLTGIAVEAQLTVTPGALAFGSVDAGFSATLTVTLLNTGSAPVTGISNAITGANAGEFVVTAPCTVTTLAPNQGCTEIVTFTPVASGASGATLNVASSNPNGTAVVAVSGTGVQAGSFVLTVNGANAGTETVASGSPGTYALLLTPQNGFTGTVALTCAPVTAGEYTSCSLLASTLTLGATAQSSVATIETITTEAGASVVALASLLIVPFGLRRRSRRGRAIVGVVMAVIVSGGFAGVAGCGGGGSGGGGGSSTVLTTPPGTYSYTVTASSTSGRW